MGRRGILARIFSSHKHSASCEAEGQENHKLEMEEREREAERRIRRLEGAIDIMRRDEKGQ